MHATLTGCPRLAAALPNSHAEPSPDPSVDGQDRPGLHDGAVAAADERVDLQVRGVEDERVRNARAVARPGQDGRADVLAGPAGAVDERDRSHRERLPGLLGAHGHLHPRRAYLAVRTVG